MVTAWRRRIRRSVAAGVIGKVATQTIMTFDGRRLCSSDARYGVEALWWAAARPHAIWTPESTALRWEMGTASQDLVDFLFEEFGDQKRNAVMLADVVEGKDLRMAQSGDGPGFLLEPAEALRIGGKRRREDLDCDIPAQAGVAGSIHFTHAAGADQGNDFIGPEFRARRQSHVRRDYTLKKE